MLREGEIELPIPPELKHEKHHHPKSLEGLRKDVIEEYLNAVYKDGLPPAPDMDKAIRQSKNSKEAIAAAINLACRDKECEPLRQRLLKFLENR